jgi:hypothetical protein
MTSTTASSMRSAGWSASSAAMISESDGRAEAQAALAQLGVQLDGVDQVPVVGERELVVVGPVDGLGVLPRVRARRGVPHVPDGQLAAEGAQLLLVEDLETRPRSRRVMMCPPRSHEAMPADSWPRCWRAKSPK